MGVGGAYGQDGREYLTTTVTATRRPRDGFTQSSQMNLEQPQCTGAEPLAARQAGDQQRLLQVSCRHRAILFLIGHASRETFNAAVSRTQRCF